MGWNYTETLPWEQLISSSVIVILPIVACAYVLGHLMDVITNRVFFRTIRKLRNRSKNTFPAAAKALEIQKEAHPNLTIQYDEKDWFLLFNLIAQRNINLSQYIDKYGADSLMLRNISLGSFLLSILQFISYTDAPSSISLLIAISALVFSIIAYSQSEDIRTWYFSSIFEASLEYGLSLEEVVKYNHVKQGNKTNE
jgi:hypothetical protein